MVSVLEKIRQLDAQKEKLLADAKKEALAKAQAAVDELNELGFNYQLTQKGGAVGTRKGTRGVDPSKPCGYCGFQTNPPHDKRAHRSQVEKAPFTDAELKELGMGKV